MSATLLERPAEAARAAVPVAPPVETPYLSLDVDAAADAYATLATAFASSAVHYAVKANPHPELLARLAAAGASFDVASPAEIDACLLAGAPPARLLYSNPVRLRRDLAYARDRGVGAYVVDSMPELHKLAETCPGADVLCRIVTTGEGSDWPLSRKFGATEQECVRILDTAARLGLRAAGVAFHVGSQQREPARWRPPIRQAARIFAALRERGLAPWLLDLGGGFPADHEGTNPGIEVYAATIEDELATSFGADRPQTLIEPGRAVAGDAGTLVTTVVGVCRRTGRRWVYLDAGVFTGLVETAGEAIRYRVRAEGASGELEPAVLAGPTCDSVDVLYERKPVRLPADLAEGDQVVFGSAGAYTSCYSTVSFNGFAPLPTRLA